MGGGGVVPKVNLAAKTWTPKTTNQTIAAGTYCTGKQTIKGDANLKAANIKKGVSIFGVTGNFPAIELAEMGFTKFAVDTFSFTSRTSIRWKSIPHSLGEIPKMIYIYATSQVTVASDVEDIIGSEFKKNSSYQLSVLANSINTNADSVRVSEKTNMNATETNIEVSGLATRYYGAGVTYKMITFA